MNESLPTPIESIAKIADALGSVADAIKSGLSDAKFSIHEICVVALAAILCHHVFAWLRGAK